MTPPERIVAAIAASPDGRATLAELAERTEYPVGAVLRSIISARRDGVRVNAVMSPRTTEGTEPTVFVVAGDANAVADERQSTRQHLTEGVE